MLVCAVVTFAPAVFSARVMSPSVSPENIYLLEQTQVYNEGKLVVPFCHDGLLFHEHLCTYV